MSVPAFDPRAEVHDIVDQAIDAGAEPVHVATAVHVVALAAEHGVLIPAYLAGVSEMVLSASHRGGVQ